MTLPRIDREALPFAAAAALLTLAAAWWLPLWTAILPAALLAFTLWFFRDPERSVPAGDDLLIAPADGRIIRADDRRISVFMNVFNVHVCRAPAAGEVVSTRHHPGRFLAAFRDDASEHNERTEIVLDGPAGPVRVVLVAGLVARRIVCRVKPGDRLEAGQRLGLIRFGSRVDVDLPPGACPETAVGRRVTAGETVLARRAGAAAARPEAAADASGS